MSPTFYLAAVSVYIMLWVINGFYTIKLAKRSARYASRAHRAELTVDMLLGICRRNGITVDVETDGGCVSVTAKSLYPAPEPEFTFPDGWDTPVKLTQH